MGGAGESIALQPRQAHADGARADEKEQTSGSNAGGQVLRRCARLWLARHGMAGWVATGGEAPGRHAAGSLCVMQGARPHNIVNIPPCAAATRIPPAAAGCMCPLGTKVRAGQCQGPSSYRYRRRQRAPATAAVPPVRRSAHRTQPWGVSMRGPRMPSTVLFTFNSEGHGCSTRQLAQFVRACMLACEPRCRGLRRMQGGKRPCQPSEPLRVSSACDSSTAGSRLATIPRLKEQGAHERPHEAAGARPTRWSAPPASAGRRAGRAGAG
jgi:hypothetical protein